MRVKLKRLTLNIRVEGAGPPLLYLGGSSFDLSIRAPVFKSELPSHFEVAAADPRGLGDSDCPDGDWSMQDFALDALSLLDKLGWETAYIIGESFGAMVALHLAALAPERINAMALCSVAPGGIGRRSYPVESLLEISDPYERACRTLSLQDSRFDSAIADQSVIAARIDFEQKFMTHKNNAKGFRKLLAARAKHDAWDKLSTIDIHTLVFAGSYDLQAPPEFAKMMVDQMPKATLHLIEGGHNICFANLLPLKIVLETWRS